MTREFRRRVEEMPSLAVIIIAIGAEAGVAALDAASGPDLSFSFFYVIPLVAVAWRFGAPGAIVGSVTAAIVWFAIDAATDPGTVLAVSAWNALIRTAFFLTITGLLAGFHALLDKETQLAQEDSLTGLPNRRTFESLAARELARSDRTGDAVTIALVDLDGLKTLNDTAGHAAGDAALVALARTLSGSIRKPDVAARIGGDEFALVLAAGTDDAATVLERIRAEVAAQRVGTFGLSCSIGSHTVRGGPLETALAEADVALYRAKRMGRGRVEAAVVPPVPLGDRASG